MVKSIVSSIVALIIVVAGGVGENVYVNHCFSELTETFSSLNEKLDSGEDCSESVNWAKDKWFDCKRKLHAFIPHTEIKEVDLWVSECAYYVSVGDADEAKAKCAVILKLFEQIPKTFSLSLENVF